MVLFAKEMGSAGTAAVFLHGFGGDHQAWRAIQPVVAMERATIAYDLPGHGGSLAFPGPGSARAAAHAVLADLSGRGIERAHLVGHSMGGAVAALMAIFEPAKVASLTLLAPGGFGPEINHLLLTRYAAATDAAALRACLEAMTGWFSPVTDDTVAHALSLRAAPGQTELLVEMAKGLAKDGIQGQLPRERLEALEMPVSVVWGDLDNVLPVRQAQGLPPAFAVHRFADLGHMLPEEAPAQMAAILQRSCGF